MSISSSGLGRAPYKVLGEWAKTTSGSTPQRGNKKYWEPEEIPWVKTGEVAFVPIVATEEFISKKALAECSLTLLPPKTVLIAMYGQGKTRGQSAVLEIEATTNQACFAILPNDTWDAEFLHLWLVAKYEDLRKLSEGRGGNQANLNGALLNTLEIPAPEIDQQRKIAAHLKAQLAEVETARQAAQVQFDEISRLANAIIFDSVQRHPVREYRLGEVLSEIKKGIGLSWADYPVLGATRDGLAPAREQPGKHAPKYKPVFPGTVFYNPMRILIGSIAMVDEDDSPGITSPDYVALKGVHGAVDSRWFYYWLRSPLGVQCINSLARGAVRERMLFNRLADGKIDLPEFKFQQKASAALKELKPLRAAVENKLREIDLMPQKILAKAFTQQGMLT